MYLLCRYLKTKVISPSQPPPSSPSGLEESAWAGKRGRDDSQLRNNSGCMFLCDSLLEKQNILHSQLQEESAGCDVKHHEGLDKSLGLYVPFVGKTGTGLRLYKNKLIKRTESAPRLHEWLGRRGDYRYFSLLYFQNLLL